MFAPPRLGDNFIPLNGDEEREFRLDLADNLEPPCHGTGMETPANEVKDLATPRAPDSGMHRASVHISGPRRSADAATD